MENAKPPDSEQQPAKKPRKKIPVKKLIAVFLLLDGLMSLYWFVLSPQACARRTVKRMAAAFEKKDMPGLMGNFSEQYADNAGNRRADIESAVKFIFERCDKLEAKINRTDVKISGDTATAMIRGRLSYSFKGIPHRTDYNQNPYVMTMKREGRKWRVTNIADIGISVSDMDSIIKEIDSF